MATQKENLLNINEGNLSNVLGFDGLDNLVEEVLERHNAISFKLSRIKDKLYSLPYYELNTEENMKMYDKVDALSNALDNISWSLKNAADEVQRRYDYARGNFIDAQKSQALKYFNSTIEYLDSRKIDYKAHENQFPRIIEIPEHQTKIHFYPTTSVIFNPQEPYDQNLDAKPEERKTTSFYNITSVLDELI